MKEREKVVINYDDPKFAGMSKKRIKKLVRKQAKKDYRKTVEKKDKVVVPRKKKDPSEKHEKVKLNKKEARENAREKMKTAPKVIIDAGWGHTFDQYSIDTLIRQLQECHSYQLKSSKPLNLIISSTD